MQARGKRYAAGTAGIMLAVAAVLLPGASDARPRLGGVFNLSGTPGQLTKGPDGNIWVILTDSDDNEKIARIRPGGNVTEYAPAELNNPIGITPGGDGNLWFTQNNEVVRVDPEDPEGSNEAFTVNAIGDPREIIRGPDNKLWTASGDQLVSFTTADPDGFDAQTIDDMGARGVAASGGRVWIADFTEKRIVRVTPGGGTRFFKVGGGPQDVAKGPKKGAAYTNQATDPHTVGRIIRGRKVRRTKVPNTDPFGITFASDRRWWIANFASHDLTILERDGDKRRFRKLPDNSGPRWITGGPNKTLWVSLELSDQVARIKGVRR